MKEHRWTLDDIIFLGILLLANAAVMWFMPAYIQGSIGWLIGAVCGIITMVAINTRFPD